MKVEKAKQKFEPVTITLESQEGLDIFTEVFYRVGGTRVAAGFRDGYAIYQSLVEVGGYADSEGLSYGTINVE